MILIGRVVVCVLAVLNITVGASLLVERRSLRLGRDAEWGAVLLSMGVMLLIVALMVRS